MAGSKITGAVAMKRAIARRMGRIAARKYTWVWNRVIKEAQGLHPKSNKIPPNFKGSQNEKFKLALLYRNRMIKYARMHPRKYTEYLYRGMPGVREREQFSEKVPNIIKIDVMRSFTKDLKVAYDFSMGQARYPATILRLKTDTPIPSINFTNGKVQSEFAPGGQKAAEMYDEKEVLLPPGTYTVNSYTDTVYKFGFITRNVRFINVTYKSTLNKSPIKLSPVVVSKLPSFGYSPIKPKSVYIPSVSPNLNVGNLYKTPSKVNRKGRVIQKGPKGGMYVLGKTGKKIYKSMLPTTTSVNAPFGKNKKNRVIQKGPKGGKFVVSKHGKKLYKFF